MWIGRYICCFMLYSFIGWVYETIFCTCTGRKWANRGFLYGPICPIYGVGILLISVISALMKGKGIDPGPYAFFGIAVFGSAILEYVTSWTLEKLFHALWWDYSRLPLNLHGRISLFTSLGFGVGGLLAVYVIAPFTERLIGGLSPIVIELLSLLLTFILAVDLTLTVTALLHFDQAVIRIEEQFNRRMESIVDGTVQQSTRILQGISERRDVILEQARAMSGALRGPLLRVHSFRDGNERKESIRSQLLSAVRNGLRSRNAGDDDEAG